MSILPMKNRSSRLNREIEAGIASSIEATFAFYVWADSMGDRLSAEAIKARFDCSRATSYRWLNAFRAAHERIVARAAT